MWLMAQLHCPTRIRIWTRSWNPNPMATLYYTQNVHIAWTQTRIPTPYLGIVQEWESESVPVSVSGYAFKP